MTNAQRNNHIQDLQLRHVTPYSSALYNRLITGGCSDLKENSQIAYMIKIWYRYWALPNTLSSYQYTTVDSVSDSVEFTVSLNGVDLSTVTSTTGSMSEVVTALVEGIQYTSGATGVYAFEYDTGFITWSSSTAYSLNNVITVTDSTGVTAVTTVDVDPTDSDNVAVILDRNNCISFCELAGIKKYLLNLLASC
tara:strand:- start:38944 stop:39525 length:582 start_codon:yes stop_codon:yes gene_type:complete